MSSLEPPRNLKGFLADLGALPCADLLGKVAMQIAALGPDVEPEVEPFTARFRVQGRTLCELSAYGELFILRIGSAGAVEYRVRHAEVAWRALEDVLRAYLLLREPASLDAPA